MRLARTMRATSSVLRGGDRQCLALGLEKPRVERRRLEGFQQPIAAALFAGSAYERECLLTLKLGATQVAWHGDVALEIAEQRVRLFLNERAQRRVDPKRRQTCLPAQPIYLCNELSHEPRRVAGRHRGVEALGRAHEDAHAQQRRTLVDRNVQRRAAEHLEHVRPRLLRRGPGHREVVIQHHEVFRRRGSRPVHGQVRVFS